MTDIRGYYILLLNLGVWIEYLIYMNNLIKYIASIILIFTGIAIMVVHHSNNRNVDPLSFFEDKEADSVVPDTINAPVDVGPFQDRVNNLIVENPDQAKILPIIIATTKTCPPCSDNIVEYADLIRQHHLFFEPTLMFVDEQADLVERFLLVNDLQLPHIITKPGENESINGLFDHLIFIDLNEEKAFYNLEIPTITISLARKEGQLREVAAIWQRVFDEEIQSSSF